MTIARQKTGARAEELVARRLAAAGWKIVERNARTRFGPERPVLAVDRRKQLRVRRLATAWMSERRVAPPYAEIRFDAVGVTFDRAGRVVDIEHIRAAF